MIDCRVELHALHVHSADTTVVLHRLHGIIFGNFGHALISRLAATGTVFARNGLANRGETDLNA